MALVARLNDTSNLCVCRYHYYYLVTALSPRFRGARLLIYGFVYEPGEDAQFVYEEYDHWTRDVKAVPECYDFFYCDRDGAMQQTSDILFLFIKLLLVESSPIMIVNKE